MLNQSQLSIKVLLHVHNYHANIIQSRFFIGCFRSAKTELNLWLAPVPASLVPEDVINRLKRLFTLNIAQAFSLFEEFDSIVLESD